MNSRPTQNPTGARHGPSKLYIFPHAGASVEFYVPFARTFSAAIKPIAVQYPHRTGRQDLPAMTSVSGLSNDIYAMFAADESASETVLFGHSMGALFAFEVARRFESAGNPITALFVSASPAPSRMRLERMPGADHELLEMATRLTGLDPEFVGNEKFAATVLPTLRSLRAIADYDCSPRTTISCPVYAFMGDGDAVADYENVAAWGQHTTSEFVIRSFHGGHHYINDHLAELVDDIENKVSRLSGLG